MKTAQNGKNSKPRPYKPSQHDEGYDKIDWGNTRHIDDGLYIKDLYDSDKFHNNYTFEGERIRVITLCFDGDYRVQFDNKPSIKLDKWAICKEVGNG